MRVIKEYSQHRVLDRTNIKWLEELIQKEEAEGSGYYPSLQIKGITGETKWMSISIDELKEILQLWKRNS